MASATSTTAQSAPKLGIPALKEAGVSSLQLALAAGVTAFAVQAAIVAGKALVASAKGVAEAAKA